MNKGERRLKELESEKVRLQQELDDMSWGQKWIGPILIAILLPLVCCAYYFRWGMP